MAAPFSPIMMVGALVLPVVSVGITEASMTRRPWMPCTRRREIDDGARILAHLAGADRVIERVAGAAGIGQQVGIAGDVGAGLDFAATVLSEGGGGEDAAHMTEAAQQGQFVGMRGEVVRLDVRPREGIGGGRHDGAAAVGLHHADDAAHAGLLVELAELQRMRAAGREQELQVG